MFYNFVIYVTVYLNLLIAAKMAPLVPQQLIIPEPQPEPDAAIVTASQNAMAMAELYNSHAAAMIEMLDNHLANTSTPLDPVAAEVLEQIRPYYFYSTVH